MDARELADKIVPDSLPIDVKIGDLRSMVAARGGDLTGIPRTVLMNALITVGNLGVCTDAFCMKPKPRWLAHLILHDGDRGTP